MPARRLGSFSTIDPDTSADRTQTSPKLARQRSDDLFESLKDFEDSTEKFSATVQPPTGEQWSESSRFAKATNGPYPTGSRPPRYAREGAFRSSFKPLSTKPTDEELKEHLESVVQFTDSKESQTHFLDSIKPALNELEPHQLAQIFDKLNAQIVVLNRRRVMTLFFACQNLDNLPGFAALLNRTNSVIQDMNNDDLLVVFKLLRLLFHDPDTTIVRSLIKQIGERLNEMDLEHLSLCLLVTNRYLQQLPNSSHLTRLRASLLEACRRRVLNDELKPENFNQLSRLFTTFLESSKSDEAFEMAERLAQLILSDCELDFSKSVFLLSDMISALPGISSKETPCPPVLSELIDRCNSIVVETLESDPDSANNHYQMLEMVHRYRSRMYFRFPNFFEPKVLELLSSFLAKEAEANRLTKKPRTILNLVHNYANQNIFNEKLIKLACQMIINRAYPVDRLTVTDYFMLSDHRWPFVERQQLLNVLKSSDRFLQSLKHGFRDQGLLCDLILNEVNDPGLLNYLNQTLNSKSDGTNRESMAIRFFNYEHIALARVCLTMFSKLTDKNLETRLKRTLDQRFHNLCMQGDRPNLSVKYIRVDSRIQAPGYLSNGIHVNSFAIYDRSMGDLIPLEQFRNKFDEINSIPLTNNQEL